MFSSNSYPVNLSLAGRKCLVVGFGQVGRRKVKGLLPAAPAKILILDLKPLSGSENIFLDFPRQTEIIYEQRACEINDIKNHFLVFAATSDPAENSRIAAICAREKTLCDSATNPDQGSFSIPAVARNHNLCVAISTGGASPLMSARMRQELEKWLEPKAGLAWILGELRPLAQAYLATPAARGEFFRLLVSSPVPKWLEADDLDSCRRWLEAHFPVRAHADLEQIITGYRDVFSA